MVEEDLRKQLKEKLFEAVKLMTTVIKKFVTALREALEKFAKQMHEPPKNKPSYRNTLPRKQQRY